MIIPKFVMFSGREFGARCILEVIKRGIIPELVVTNPEDDGEDKPFNKSVKKVCNDNCIRNMSFTAFKQSKNFILEKQIQIGLSTFCSRLIPDNIIKQFKLGITNIHFSLLPKYRGQFPTVHAIYNGETVTGVTLHWINSGVDSGDIILQSNIQIDVNETGFSLFNKTLEVGVKMFNQQLDFLINSSWPHLRKISENELLQNPVNHSLPNNGELEWSWSGQQIKNFLRAVYHPQYKMPIISIGNQRFELNELN